MQCSHSTAASRGGSEGVKINCSIKKKLSPRLHNSWKCGRKGKHSTKRKSTKKPKKNPTSTEDNVLFSSYFVAIESRHACQHMTIHAHTCINTRNWKDKLKGNPYRLSVFTTVYLGRTRTAYIGLYPPAPKSSGHPRVLFRLYLTGRHIEKYLKSFVIVCQVGRLCRTPIGPGVCTCM